MATTSANNSASGSSSSFAVGSAGGSRAIDILASVSTPTPTPASTAEVSLEPKQAWQNPGDSCTWYAGGTCYAPRSCADCINVNVQNDACAVDPNGMCVSMATYSRYASRSRGDRGQVGFNGYFPAANFTYCPVDDATCNACKTEWRNEYWSKNQAAPPAVCRGADGCVCISACEVPDRAESIVMNSCTMFGFDRSKLVSSAYITAGVFAIMVAFFIMYRSWSKKRALREYERSEQEREERRERRRQLMRERQLRTGPLLSLGGWNSLRDKLLETEREHGQRALAGIGVATGDAVAESEPHASSRVAAATAADDASERESKEEEAADDRSARASPAAVEHRRQRDDDAV